MERILVSACLLGLCCRYDGKSKADARVLALLQDTAKQLIPYCPECYGGLPIPRPPSEQLDGRVFSKNGTDVTAEYERGAKGAKTLCRLYGCTAAILKARSPSCGSGEIYDGSFSGKRIPGDGITARLLKETGIRVLTEEELDRL